MTNKKLTPFVFCILLSLNLFGQADSLRNEILNYRDSKSDIIKNGRRILSEEIAKDNKHKVDELVRYLLLQEDENYLAFYRQERWMLFYYIGNYNAVLQDVLLENSDYLQFNFHGILPPNDWLDYKLTDQLLGKFNEIEQDIQSTVLLPVERSFLILKLNQILSYKEQSNISKDMLNSEATEFINAYPNSEYEEYVRYNIRYQTEPSKWAYGMEFFLGYGVLSENLSDCFSNNMAFGIAFEIYYYDFVFYLRDYVGFGKTRKTIDFSTGIWEDDSRTNVIQGELSLGYVTIDNSWIRVTPFLGISGLDISPPQSNKGVSGNDVGLEFTSTYTYGITIDYKLGRKNQDHSDIQNIGLLRFRYAYNQPQYGKKYTGFDGDFQYFTLGIAGFIRNSKRVL